MSEKIDFISGCPVEGCVNRKKLIRWKHNGCGGEMWIDEYGYIECKKCSKKFKLTEMEFRCDGNHDLKKVNVFEIIRWLSMAGNSQEFNESFVYNIINNIKHDM